MRATSVTIALAILATIGAQAAWSEEPATTGKLPAFVNWSYKGAFQQDNGCRAKICLNGWWRWLPAEENRDEPPTSGWFYRKVPGVGTTFNVLDASGKPAPKLTRQQRTGTAWLQRQFTIPEAWKGKEVCLYLGCVLGRGEIWLDSQRLGYAWYNSMTKVEVPKPYRFDQPYLLTVKGSGIADNVWLAALNPGPRITDNYLTTSVEDMAATLRAAGAGPGGPQLKVTISEYQKPKQIAKGAGPFPVKKAEEDHWTSQDTFPWEDAKLWSLQHPNLYQYTLQLTDPKGKVLDQTFPQRFGFRQFDIKDGRFRLNLKPLVVTNDVHSGAACGGHTLGRASNPETNRKIIDHWKNLGVNCVQYRWGLNLEDDPFIRAADELGFLISLSPYGIATDERHKDIAERNQWLKNFSLASFVPKRHCPSLAYYALDGTHSYAPCYDYHPDHLGGDFDKGKDHRRETREFLKKHDPARFATACSGGGKYEPVHGSMNYIPIDADLQVHENWPSKWAKTRKKPLMTYEMEAPSYVSNWQGRRNRGQQLAPQPFFLEVGAIHLGEEPFIREPRENIESRLKKAKDASHGSPKNTWTHDETTKLFVRNVLRAWRTYGANPGLFIMVREWYTDPIVIQPQKDLDPRRPGAYPDSGVRPHTWQMKPRPGIWEAAYAGLAPLIAYLGGPDGDFSRKDRSYWTGEKVRKAVVVVNNTEDPVKLSGQWRLETPDGREVLAGKLSETEYAPGELGTNRLHLELEAPRVEQRTDYVLKLLGQANREGVLEDRFSLTVFPKAAPPAIPDKMKVLIYDPIGQTAKVLTRAGVKFEHLKEMPMPSQEVLLVIGCNALKSKDGRERFKEFISPQLTYDFATTFPIGLRVLVFEQALSNLWGLKTEESRWRRSFIRAPGHPALKGLENIDFTYFRGNSDLAEAYPKAPEMPKRLCIDRFPEWGNDNVVTTFPFYMPQEGACRALLDCGFGLLETPLLEYAAGKGRMIFCQTDVTSRYAYDPVAAHLVNNLLEYLASAAPPDPAVGKPIDLVREGYEDYGVDVKTEEVYLLDRPEGEISWGISYANVYFQEFIKLPVILGPDGKKFVTCRIKGERKFAHTLNKRNLKTGWQKMNANIVRNALWINQGGAGNTFPEPSLQDNQEQLYPYVWYEYDGYVDPYLMMQW